MDNPTPLSTPPQVNTSLPARLMNIFVSPAYVFDEVIRSPHRVLNCVVPIVLVTLASLLLLGAVTTKEHVADRIRGELEKDTISADQADIFSKQWVKTSIVTVCIGSVAGTVWSAFIIWGMGRFLVKARFSFSKALEVVSLTGLILALGAITTLGLVGATGDPLARPALSLIGGKLQPDNPLRLVLDSLNVFHLWTTTTLAIGLSRLSGVSLKEAGFWVFGYWVVARIALILLA